MVPEWHANEYEMAYIFHSSFLTSCWYTHTHTHAQTQININLNYNVQTQDTASQHIIMWDDDKDDDDDDDKAQGWRRKWTEGITENRNRIIRILRKVEKFKENG